MASPRSAKLFGLLPDNIKAVLGDEFNLERWSEIKDSAILPTYLLDIEISAEPGVQKRGTVPLNSHLVGPDPLEEDDELDDLLDTQDDRLLGQLSYLHNNNLLLCRYES